MQKTFLKNLLQEYDNNKGIRRRLFGDDAYIKELRAFVHQDLRTFCDTDTVRNPQLAHLYAILRRRKSSLKPNDQYYNRDRPSNHIFHKIIFEMAQDHYDTKLAVQVSREQAERRRQEAAQARLAQQEQTRREQTRRHHALKDASRLSSWRRVKFLDASLGVLKRVGQSISNLAGTATRHLSSFAWKEIPTRILRSQVLLTG